MKLILQAIKALFRKVEGAVSTLSGRIGKVEAESKKLSTGIREVGNLAGDAASMAGAALSKAVTAQTTANTAQDTANDAKTAAANAQTTADKKAGFSEYTEQNIITDALNIQVGESYSVTKGRLAFNGLYKAGTVVSIRLDWYEGSSLIGVYVSLLAVNTAYAYGITEINGKIFFVSMVNGVSSSAIWLTRLANEMPSDEHINSLIDSKLGVIENGTY